MNPVVRFYIYTLTDPKFRVKIKRCTKYGLKSILIAAIAVLDCLLLRVQPPVVDENRTNTNKMPATPIKRANTVHFIQHQEPMNMPPVA
jgi:hypothetical protein